MAEPIFDEVVFRAAVTQWEVDYDRASLQRIATGAGVVLGMLDAARAELKQLTTATTYLQGPEECLERECEEYYDDNGDERPGVEYCSHLKANRLDVDEHLAALAKAERLTGQVKRVREVAAYFRDREADLKRRYDQSTDDAQATALLSSAALTGDAAHRIERALDGTEAGR